MRRTTDAPVVLVIDGNSLFHRAWHAYERSGLTTATGRPVFATYGFLALLAGICEKVDPDALVIGFDDQKGSDRRRRCPAYKATRGEKSPDLYVQMNDTHLLLRELGVSVVTPEGLEADDVLGSVAAAAEATGWRCVIATSDRDSFALISEHTTVLRLVTGLDNAVWMTPQKLEATYGVAPGAYLDYAVMRGDTSDNLAGVKGIGEKTAAKVLAAFGSLDAALADRAKLEEVAGKVTAAKLFTAEATAAIATNRDIMAICRDVPVDLEAARLGVDSNRVRDVLRRAELPNLVNRVAVALARPVRRPPAAVA